MAKTAEQVLRELVAEQIFTIARLVAENDRLTEEVQKLALKNKESESSAKSNLALVFPASNETLEEVKREFVSGSE